MHMDSACCVHRMLGVFYCAKLLDIECQLLRRVSSRFMSWRMASPFWSSVSRGRPCNVIDIRSQFYRECEKLEVML